MSFRKILCSIVPALIVSVPMLAQQAIPSEVTFPRDAARTRPNYAPDAFAKGTGLPSWEGSFQHHKKTYRYTMVGTDPALGGMSTTVPVVIVPLELTFQDSGMAFDATAPMIGKTRSALEEVELSPVFYSGTKFMAGPVEIGKTQLVDAFQRANFWKYVVSPRSEYHVLLGQPLVLPKQSYRVPASAGQTFTQDGLTRGVLDGGWIDQNITGPVFAQHPEITPQTVTIFLTYNVFPASAYGYHDAYGPSPETALTYMYVSYLEPYKKLIDADISTLVHEVAEWMDDPYVNNVVSCGYLEVGDPLNSNIFSVKSHGQTWHPQDLALLGYFSYDSSQSVNDWISFRGDKKLKPCH